MVRKEVLTKKMKEEMEVGMAARINPVMSRLNQELVVFLRLKKTKILIKKS
jgi:hypothetical protein